MANQTIEDAPYHISMSISHPEIEPAFLTEKLGLTPGLADRKGEATKRLKFLEGTPQAALVNRRSLWIHSFDISPEESLNVSLSRVLAKLKEHPDLLEWLRKTEGRISVTVYLFPTFQGDKPLDYALITEFRRLHVGFSIDNFPRDDYSPLCRREKSVSAGKP